MVEFIIAATLTLLVLALGSQSLTSSQNIVKTSGDREVMTSIASSTLEKAIAFSCGSEVNPDSTFSPDCYNLVPLYSNSQSLANQLKNFNPQLIEIKGDGIFSTTLNQGYANGPQKRKTDVTVLLSTEYVGSGGNLTDLCGSSPNLGSNLIKRSVKIIWKDYLNNAQSVNLTTYNATGKIITFNSNSITYTIPSHSDDIALLIINSNNKGLVKVMPKSCTSGMSYTFTGLTSGTYTIKSYNIDKLGIISDLGNPFVRTV
jgi:hypothetical protein